VVHLQPRHAVAERKEERQIRETRLEGLHDLSPSLPHLLRVRIPRFRRRIALLAIVEQRGVILFGIEENPNRSSLVGDASCQAGIAEDGREVVKPVHVAGAGVEAEEIVREALERRGAEVFQAGC